MRDHALHRDIAGESGVPGRIVRKQLLDDSLETAAFCGLQKGEQLLMRPACWMPRRPVSLARLQDDRKSDLGRQFPDLLLRCAGQNQRKSGPGMPASAANVRWTRLSTTESATSGVW